MSDFFYEMTGDIELSADADNVFSCNFLFTSSGNIELSADADNVFSCNFLFTSSGNIELSADADALKIGLINVETSGGILASGESYFESSIPSFGGMSCGGESEITVVFNHEPNSGALLLGSSIKNAIYTHAATGSVLISGEPYFTLGFITFGGIIASGLSDVLVESTYGSIGGIKAGSSSQISFLYFPETSGGSTHAGTATIRIIFLPSGSIFCGGESIVEIGFTPLGGIQAGVKSDIWYYIYEPRLIAPASGSRSSGTALNVGKRVFFDQASGSVSLQGSSETSISSASVLASGALRIDGSPSYNYIFKKNLQIIYNLNGKIVKTLQFNWNLGQLTMYWYRVVGKGTTDPCIPQEPCCQKIIMNVHARSLTELCEKLSSRRFKFPIESVQRFRRSAENAVVTQEEQNGINQNCNDLIPVEVCKIPACADFCVDQDISEVFGFSFTVQVDAFKSFQAAGSVVLFGIADARLDKNLPNLKHEVNGGISISGNFSCFPSVINSRGGASCGGIARLRHSRWRYAGGVWPYTTTIRYPSETENFAILPTEQVWSLPNRVLKDDNLYASTDISYAKTSQTLFVRGFNLKFPEEDITILRLLVYVDRVATQVGIRDLELYLVNDTTKISNNLAVTGTDWPFLQTVRTYGSTGWRDPNSDDYIGPIKKEELNNSQFGIALKVNSIYSSTFALARINYIAVEVVYETVNGSILRASSGTGVRIKSSSIHWTASGKILLKGESVSKPKKKFFQRIRSAGSKLGGIGHIQFFESSLGGSKVGGEARVTPFIEEPMGGVSTLGEAEVKPFWDVMSGGTVGSGRWSGSGSWHYLTSGEISIAGNAITPEKKYSYYPNSGVEVNGGARIRKNNWKWISDGNAIFAFGSSNSSGGSIKLANEQFTFSMTILSSNISFLSDIDKQDAVGSLDFFNKCGCFNVPSTINISHNFSIDNVLASFLIRNNFTIAKTFELRYNEINNSWQSNLHYKGLSTYGDYYENWNIVCEVQCTNVVGSIVLGKNIWKTAIQISRLNLLTNEKNDSRIILAVLPDNICATSVSQLDFQIVHNTQTGISYANPSSAAIYQSMVYDNIGLFKSRAWYENPDLTIRVAQSTLQVKPRKVTFSIVR
jgi:hypothetical protein